MSSAFGRVTVGPMDSVWQRMSKDSSYASLNKREIKQKHLASLRPIGGIWARGDSFHPMRKSPVTGFGLLEPNHMSDEDLKNMFLDMPPDKQERIHDMLANLFAKLEADWKAKPENAGKQVKYRELWEDFLKKKGESIDGGHE